MPVIETKAAASSQGYGEFAKQGGPATYIEDVFSTYLYTGNGSTQTITNGIDLAGKGGLVWTKRRDASQSHGLWDTIRGANNQLFSDLTADNNVVTQRLNSFNSDGFTLGSNASGPNISSATYASWTFRKQPKFFDVVTYTGTGVARTISHSLGSVPGCIIVKKTSGIGGWMTYHRSTGATQYLFLNTTDAAATATEPWNNTAPTSSVFTVGTSNSTNQSGETYVAYIFAHDAGGFGATGTDNVISCGSYTGDGGTGATSINIGYEPQWLLVKNATGSAENWGLFDNMRGLCVEPNTSNDAILRPNTSNDEGLIGAIEPTSTGFKTTLFTNYNASGVNYIYIAIRRPMKTPTTGTSVFTPISNAAPTTGCLTDLTINRNVTSGQPTWAISRLTNRGLETQSTNAETDTSPYVKFDRMTGVTDNGWQGTSNVIWWDFKRAPGFFDVVCYTGNDANRTLNHNLGVAPELIIIKSRNATAEWITSVPGGGWGNTQYLIMNNTFAVNNYGALNVWNATAPTSTVFSLGTITSVNWSSANYIAYLFASCPGVSKVGNYTGNGSSQTINCGFTGGARFVLIKRTDSAGSWLVWDTARGIVAGNDPYLALNSTAAQVTSDDSIDTNNSGFVVNQVTATNINVNGGSYIYLAIA